jgi:hypothetical protein
VVKPLPKNLGGSWPGQALIEPGLSPGWLARPTLAQAQGRPTLAQVRAQVAAAQARAAVQARGCSPQRALQVPAVRPTLRAQPLAEVALAQRVAVSAPVWVAALAQVQVALAQVLAVALGQAAAVSEQLGEAVVVQVDSLNGLSRK